MRSASSRPKIDIDINSRCRGTAFDFTTINALSRKVKYISTIPVIIGWLEHESRSWPIHGSLGAMALYLSRITCVSKGSNVLKVGFLARRRSGGVLGGG